MDGRKLGFLTSVLGKEGARALSKAVERSTALGNVVLPRAIVAWLGAVPTYEGEIPGVANTYVSFAKSESGFSGSVAIEDTMYEFADQPILRVAAAMAVALGADREPVDPTVRDLDLARLGKSIELLVKARMVAAELAKTTEAPRHGVAAAPRKPENQEPPDAPKKQPAMPRPPAPKARGYVPPAPKATVPAIPGVGRPKLPGIQLPKLTKFAPRCGICGGGNFSNSGALRGCLCIRDLIKSVRFEDANDRRILHFGPELDHESISVILDALGVTHA